MTGSGPRTTPALRAVAVGSVLLISLLALGQPRDAVRPEGAPDGGVVTRPPLPLPPEDEEVVKNIDLLEDLDAIKDLDLFLELDKDKAPPKKDAGMGS